MHKQERPSLSLPALKDGVSRGEFNESGDPEQQRRMRDSKVVFMLENSYLTVDEFLAWLADNGFAPRRSASADE